MGAATGKTMNYRVLAFGLVFSASTLAETSLPQVLVSAARTPEHSLDIPAAATVIDQQEIEDSGARNVAELLRSVTGCTSRA